MKRRMSRVALLVAAVVLAAAMPALAQDYPNRPIRFIVPYPPGGGTDVVARIMSDALAADLGQPIIIDNRGGAAGNVGTDIAAKAAADGYNILFTLSSHTINPKLYDKLPFDVERDFVPISLAALIPQILVVHPSVPANNVQELIALATAMALSLPAFTCCHAAGIDTNRSWTCPPIVSMTAGPPPLYGMCTMSIPVLILRSSPAMWPGEPVTTDA